jgi:hypothetical protein
MLATKPAGSRWYQDCGFHPDRYHQIKHKNVNIVLCDNQPLVDVVQTIPETSYPVSKSRPILVGSAKRICGESFVLDVECSGRQKKSKSHYDRQSVGQSVLVSGDQFVFLLEILFR